MGKSFSSFITALMQLGGFVGLSYALTNNDIKAICLGIILFIFYSKLSQIIESINKLKNP